MPAVVVEWTASSGVDQQRSDHRSSVEDVAQLTGGQFDGEENATDSADISAADQTAARPGARYQAFRLDGLHL